MKPLLMDNIFFIGSLCIVAAIVFFGSFLFVLIAIGGFVLLFSKRLEKIEERWSELDEKSRRESGRKD